jgi:hypothetical protein
LALGSRPTSAAGDAARARGAPAQGTHLDFTSDALPVLAMNRGTLDQFRQGAPRTSGAVAGGGTTACTGNQLRFAP